ncbi:MAG TPA: hypothetical protein VGM03_23745 [Phycisphaerae bacterium]
MLATIAYLAMTTAEPDRYVGWGTLSLLNAGLAQAKNRSGLAWWLVSLLLGPIATLLLVLLSPAPRLPVVP